MAGRCRTHGIHTHCRPPKGGGPYQSWLQGCRRPWPESPWSRAGRLGTDFGALRHPACANESWRRFDTFQMGVTTDVLNRLSLNDIGPIRAVRDIGLGLVDRMPGLKNFFIRQASGLAEHGGSCT